MSPQSLVTGGAGFIGSHVAQALLDRGHTVTVVDDLSGGYRENVPAAAQFVEVDVSDESAVTDLFRDARFEYVFHLAAYAAEGLSHFIRRFNYVNNVVGSMNVLNAAVNTDVRCFVFTSSIAAYGRQPVPMTEEMTPKPEDPYGIAKYAVEMDLAAAHEMFGLDYIVFRPHNVYGEAQNLADPYRNVLGIFMNQVMSGEPLTIFGDGEQTRAFSHIADVAPLIAASIDIPDAYNTTFNVGADTPYTVNELAEEVARAFAVAPDIKYLPTRHEVMHAHCSHDRLQSVFGVEPKIALPEGVDRMARWARQMGAQRPSTFGSIEVERNLPPSWALRPTPRRAPSSE
jgi:UDP-glucose 4-epimerase